MSRQTLIFDSTQLSTMLECEQKHDYEFAQSLVQINQKDPKLTFQVPDKIAAGSLGHKYLEIYYKSLALCGDPGIAAQRALLFDPDKEDTVDPEFPLSADMRKRVRRRFEEYLMNYGGRDYNVAIRHRTQIGIQDGWLKDIRVPEPLVEQGFSYALYDTNEYLFVLEGRIDFLGSSGGEDFWMDHKWQMRERDLYPKSIQFRNYSLATGYPLGIINYVRLHDKVGTKTFVRQPISFSPGERRAWKEELTEIYVRIAKRQRSGDYPQMNRGACPGKYGYPCDYAPLCNVYDLSQRAASLKMNFTKKKEWKPW